MKITREPAVIQEQCRALSKDVLIMHKKVLLYTAQETLATVNEMTTALFSHPSYSTALRMNDPSKLRTFTSGTQ
jgi:hypothetical protein